MILPEYEAKNLLAKWGIPIVTAARVTSREEAKRRAAEAGYPVALKFASPRYAHKSDIGGVRLGLGDEASLSDAFGDLDRLRERLDPSGEILLERMVEPGVELFIGARRHPQFGPVVSVGLGGMMVELVEDVASRLLPASRRDFREMLEELKAWPKLRKGFRGLPPVNADSMIELLDKVGGFVLDNPNVMELDLNPLIAGVSGVIAVDAMIVVEERSA